MFRFRAGVALSALVLSTLPIAALGQPAEAGPTGIRPTACGPGGGTTDCSAGGSHSTPGRGGGNASDGTDLGYSWDVCGGHWDTNGDGTKEYPYAVDHAPAGYAVTEDGCQLTLPDGSTGGWDPEMNSWIVREMPEQGPPPEWCTGYDPNGRWYWGVVAQTSGPQPIWGDRNHPTGAGTCPTPGDMGQVAAQMVEAWITKTLEPGDIALAPPEDDPDAMGVVGRPVWMWFENPTVGTVGSEEPVTLTEGAVTVTMQVELENVDFDMGDGNTVTCEYDPETGTVGTPYTEEMDGVIDSPSGCQHVYETVAADSPDGTFTIQATSNWNVTWSVDIAGAVEEGEENPTSGPSEATVRIVEVQTIR